MTDKPIYEWPKAMSSLALDFSSSIRLLRFSWTLAKMKLRAQYRGSIIGPFWITISSAIFFLGLGLIYSYLWKAELADYLPWLMTGFSVWIFISQSITESCNIFISAEPLMKRRQMPLSSYVFQHMFYLGMFFAHLAPILMIAFLVSSVGSWLHLLVLPLSITIYAINLYFLTIVLGLICARFRDLQQAITTMLQLLFFMTPIIWSPSQLGENQLLIYLNPLSSFVELVRAPILGQAIHPIAIITVIVLSFLNALVAFTMFKRFQHRLIFWL